MRVRFSTVDGSARGLSALCLALLGLLALPMPAAAQGEDAWASLAAARAELERAAWQADFVQTYVPAGFSSGERETGRLAISLPGQLRWDYEVPYPKAFLISGRQAYTWNAGEATGRRAVLEEKELAHLALLELDLEELRGRYSAAFGDGVAEGVAEGSEGAVEIVLAPLGSDVDIRSASIVLDAEGKRITALAYSDLEGNTTRFDLSGHRIVADTTLFEPPTTLDWLDG